MTNKAYPWMYGHLKFSIPEEGEEGFIEDISDPSLGVMTVLTNVDVPSPSSGASPDTTLCSNCSNQTNSGTEVKNDIPVVDLKAKDEVLYAEQMWERAFINDNGYFQLENLATGAVFTACKVDASEYRDCELEGLHWVSRY